MTSLGRRVARLQGRRQEGCATCRSWSGVVYEDGDGLRDRPDACPGCGREVPIRLLRQIIGISWADI